MKTKIISVVLAIAAVFGGVSPALANEIPSGYVLVPMANFGLPTANTPAAATPAAAISPTKSSLRTSSDVGTAGVDDIRVTATLRDESGRPLADQKINLVSSRADDIVAAVSSATNANGEATFAVRGGSEGMSTLTALAADGTAVAERPKIVFLKNKGGTSSPLVAGLLSADTLETDSSAVEANYSEFFDVTVPSSLRVGQPADISIRVTDAEGATAENFIGMVSFKSNDEKAILPIDYVFQEIDRGQHTFANALTFGQAGMQKVVINSSDTNVQPAEILVEVFGAGTEIKTEILEPQNNMIISSENFNVIGVTSPNSNVAAVLDGEVAARGSSESDGSFFFSLTNASEGEHELKVGVISDQNSLTETSNTINISVDNTLPDLAGFSITPAEKVFIGEEVEFVVKSEPGLFEVAVSDGKDEVLLTENDSGKYSAAFTPSSAGQFSLALRLTDTAGNSTIVNPVGDLVVEQFLEETIQNVEFLVDGANVDMVWDDPTNSLEVDHFLVKYGPDPESLTREIETIDNTPAAIVGEIEKDQKYFFQIFSVNASGQKNGQSAIVEKEIITPKTISDITTLGRNARVDMMWAPPENHSSINFYRILYGTEEDSLNRVFETGDNRTSWYIDSLQNDTVYFFKIESVNSDNQINGLSDVFSITPHDTLGLVATSCDSRIRLAWKESENPAIASWQIAYGVRSDDPTEFRVLPGGNDRMEWEIRDLVNGVNYFVALQGLDMAGQTVFVSDEVVAMPIAGACHAAAAIEAPIETPLQLWVREDENKQKILVWSPDPAASAYKIYAGTAPNFFDLPTVVVNTPYFRPEGLLANEDYFFAVRAVYADGSESVSTSSVARLEVGPLATLFASLALALGATMLIYHRKIFG